MNKLYYHGMSTIPYTLKFNCMGEWARQQSLFKLRDTYVAYGVRGLKIAGNTIEQVAEFNFLGINIDQNITWKSHVTKTAIKISRVIGVLNKLKHIFP